MIKYTDLKNVKSISAYNYQEILPYNNKQFTIIELSKYLNSKYDSSEACDRFNKFVDSKTNIKNQKAVLMIIDDQTIMCLKVITYAEALLIGTIVENDQSKLAGMKEMMYISEYNNEESFSDAIHQLFLKNAFKKADYSLEFEEIEALRDELQFANNAEMY